MASSRAVSDWISNNSNNADAISNAAKVPQAISPAFGFFVEDQRPIQSWAIAAPFEAALIYFVVLLFPLALWGYIGRSASGKV